MHYAQIVLAAGLPNPKHATEQSWFVPYILGVITVLLVELVLRTKPWR